MPLGHVVQHHKASQLAAQNGTLHHYLNRYYPEDPETTTIAIILNWDDILSSVLLSIQIYIYVYMYMYCLFRTKNDIIHGEIFSSVYYYIMFYLGIYKNTRVYTKYTKKFKLNTNI